jgi:serine O-acetyltransferase
LLFYKGFLGLATYRAANCLWKNERHTMALFFQNRASEVFGIDIHPAANIAGAVMMDHATGIVIGETCNIESEVSIFQGVTLGGTGKITGDRHPKVRKGVLISAGAKIIGNVEIGEGAKVAAGSVVLEDVEMNTTVAGVPAIAVGKPATDSPAKTVDHSIKD